MREKQVGIYEQLESMLSTMQLGDVSSDHRAEVAGYQGWNYVAIAAVCKQASRSLTYVYDDRESPDDKDIRKNLRAEKGWNWRKSYTREHQGKVVDASHPLLKLLNRPNPHQSGSSFRSEQVMQLRLHGNCIVWNRPNAMHSRTVERYVIPMSLCRPIPAGYRKNMPRGGLKILPTNSMQSVASVQMAESMAPINRFSELEIPVESLTIVRYPHPFLRGDGMSPTSAASKWIDTGTAIDDVRLQFYGKGPNGQIIVQCEEDDPKKIAAIERSLNEKLGPEGPQVVVLGNAKTLVSQRTAEELGFDVSSDAMRNAILASHHVSRAMVGDQDGMTYGSLAASLLGGTILSVQPDMDMIADEDTLDLCYDEAYKGQELSIEYEVPSIEDPDLEERRIDADARNASITLGEYRRRRGLPEFGDERDEMMMTKDGPIPLADFIKGGAASAGMQQGPPGAEGGFPGGPGVAPPGMDGGDTGEDAPPWEFSYRSPIRKSAMAMGTLGCFAPLIAMEVDGTIFDPWEDDKPVKVGKGSIEAIRMLKSCGCEVSAITSRDPELVQQRLRDSGLDVEVNVPKDSIVWDRVVEGVDGDNRIHDLRRVVDMMPDCQAKTELMAAISPPGKEKDYGVIMLPLDGAFGEAVKKIGKGIDRNDLAEGGLESEPHVTLLYGLVGSDASEVSTSVSRMGAPSITIGNIGKFSDKGNGKGCPLILKVESQHLHDMNAKVRKLFPHVETFKDYKPHITIAYVKPGAVDKYTGPCVLSGAMTELTTADVRMAGDSTVTVPLKEKLRLPDAIGESLEVSHIVGETITRSYGRSIEQVMEDATDKALHAKIDSLSDAVNLWSGRQTETITKGQKFEPMEDYLHELEERIESGKAVVAGDDINKQLVSIILKKFQEGAKAPPFEDGGEDSEPEAKPDPYVYRGIQDIPEEVEESMSVGKVIEMNQDLTASTKWIDDAKIVLRISHHSNVVDADGKVKLKAGTRYEITGDQTNESGARVIDLVEVKTKARPHTAPPKDVLDGDGDGKVYDGTKWERPADTISKPKKTVVNGEQH